MSQAMKDRPGQVRPEWVVTMSVEEEQRLRAISPITERTSHLRSRWSAQHECFLLYQWMPKAMLTKDRALQLAQHWTELPLTEQMGRRACVSDYQFWVFRTYGYEATTFWCLQGTQFLLGGTPTHYTDREKRLLEAEGQDVEPIPIGTFPNVPFDNRAVEKIQQRDKLLQAGNDLSLLERQNRPDWQKAADEQNEREYRRKFLAWNNRENGPIHEFLKWQKGRDQYNEGLAPAPVSLMDDIAFAKERYIDTGISGSGVAGSRKIQVVVR